MGLRRKPTVVVSSGKDDSSQAKTHLVSQEEMNRLLKEVYAESFFYGPGSSEQLAPKGGRPVAYYLWGERYVTAQPIYSSFGGT